MTTLPIATKAGDTLVLEFTLLEANGSASDLTGATIRWGLWPVLDAAGAALGDPVLTRSRDNGITVSSNIVRVRLDKGDTPAGRFYHELEVTMANGESSTPFDGPFTAHQSGFSS